VDKIIASLLESFSNDFDCQHLQAPDRFEHFVAWLTVRRHYSTSAFSPADLATGGANDTGIDAIGIIVNGNLVTDVDTIQELIEVNRYLDVVFIFVQAKTSPHFSASDLGSFCYGVKDFFGAGNLTRNLAVENSAEIMKRIYAATDWFKPQNPSCYLYYATPGTWNGENDLVKRIATEKADLEGLRIFSKVEIEPVDSTKLEGYYRQAKNAVKKQFNFETKVVIPDVSGVEESYIGFLPARDFLKLICDDDGKLISSLFYENVRDFQGYVGINKEIRDTLGSKPDRFVLMNNGVTIIAKILRTTGNRFNIEDFQIVNGCQTSDVLFDNSELKIDDVLVPLRLISTQDDEVFESIIRATNRQTPVKEDQFFALEKFAKKLELFFQTYPPIRRLFYERRTHQYDSQVGLDRSRIIVHQNLVRAVGAMFLMEPHITTKNYKSLETKVKNEIFKEGQKLSPYFVAASAFYRVERLFNTKKIDVKYKAARYQLLLIARFIIDPNPLPPMTSKEMDSRCLIFLDNLWNDEAAEAIFMNAVTKLEEIVGSDWTRDSIRTEPKTKSIVANWLSK